MISRVGSIDWDDSKLGREIKWDVDFEDLEDYEENPTKKSVKDWWKHEEYIGLSSIMSFLSIGIWYNEVKLGNYNLGLSMI